MRTISEATRARKSGAGNDGGSQPAGDKRGGEPGLAYRLEHLTTVAGPLVAAATPAQAARATAEAAARLAPVVGAVWLAEDGSGPLALGGLAGLDRRDRARLEGDWGHLPRSLLDAPVEARERTARELAMALGVEHVAMRRAGASLLVVGGARDPSQVVASALATLLEGRLTHAGDASTARARGERIDLGLAWTAHELMAPLIAARAALDQLSAGGGVRPAEAGETVREVAAELDELVQMCDDLLRWTAGGARPYPDLVDVNDVVQEAIGTCRLEGRQPPVAVVVRAGALVEADRVQLRIVIANLVRNALAYTPPGGAITVSLEENDSVATVTVEDEGPGVPEGEREQIFHAFARGSAADGMRAGHGLGLYIARRIVDAHGGTLWVEPGRRGAAFRLELPAVPREVVDAWAS